MEHLEHTDNKAVYNNPSWWRPVWICVAGEQPLPNILPILAYKPEKVILLHTNMKASEDSAKRCSLFFRNRNISAYNKVIDAFDIDSIRRETLSLIESEGNDRVLLNWTGGTKPMSIGALLAGSDIIPHIYYDSRMGIMINFQTPYIEIPNQKSKLSLGDMISLHADAELLNFIKFPGNNISSVEVMYKNMTDKNLNKLLIYRENTLKQLKRKKSWMAISGNGIPRPFENSELGNSLTNAMIKDHLLISEKPFRPNNKGLDFLEGFWFEGFILKKVAEGMKALNIDPSSAMLCTNVNIKWRSKIVVGNETTSKSGTNEIDIAFIANDSLYLISCTTASESEVEKRRQAVENFSDRLGGRFAKAMIACTLPNNDSFAKIFSRKSQRMLITNFTHWLKPANVLDEWFNMAK